MGLHPLLKEMPGVNIVGLDFLEFGDGVLPTRIFCLIRHLARVLLTFSRLGQLGLIVRLLRY